MENKITKSNRKKQKRMKLKGLHTPRWILFFKGFWAAKILKTAGFDEAEGCVYSNYFKVMSAEYESYCHRQIRAMEEALYPSRTAGAKILIGDGACVKRIMEIEAKTDSDSCNSREMDKYKKNIGDTMAIRHGNIEKMTEIIGRLEAKEGIMTEEFQSLAKKIEGMFVSYTNGMLLRRSLEGCIPKLDFVHIFDEYHSRYQDKDALFINYVKEAAHV